MSRPLYIFLDESGNLDFSTKGSRFWSLTALCTSDPAKGRNTFLSLHYELAAQGSGIEHFHATEDKQAVRDLMFDKIIELEDGCEVHTVLAEKRKAHPSLYKSSRMVKGKPKEVSQETKFYSLVCRILLKFIMNRGAFREASSFVIVLSSIFNKEKHAQIEGALKTALKGLTSKPFWIYFRANKSDINCQIADYCGWAIYVAWERSERRPLDKIGKIAKSQFDLFRIGTRIFY
jgi:hypothetical protein